MARSTPHFFFTFVILLLGSFVARAQGPSLSVGTASAAPGQKSTGYIEVPAGMDAATSIPVVVINGAKPGPVLALVTGARNRIRLHHRGRKTHRPA